MTRRVDPMFVTNHFPKLNQTMEAIVGSDLFEKLKNEKKDIPWLQSGYHTVRPGCALFHAFSEIDSKLKTKLKNNLEKQAIS